MIFFKKLIYAVALILISMTGFSQLQIDDVTATDVFDCYGGSTGTITITASGGTPPVTYSIGAGFQASNVFNGLTSGPYTVRVKDFFQTVTYYTPVYIDEPDEIQITNQDHTNVTGCFGNTDGTITIEAIGGTGALSYFVSGAGPNPIGSTVTGLAAGTYTITVSDANGCTKNGYDIEITQPLELVVTDTLIVDAFPCYGADNGIIELTTTGGTAPIQFSIDGGMTYQGSGYFSPLLPGTYSVLIEDSKGCTVNVDNLTVSEPPEISLDSESYTDVNTCNGDNSGTITIVASGGTGSLIYSIDGGVNFETSGNFTGLYAGTYDIVVMDGNSCSVNGQTFNIGEPPEIIIDSVRHDDVLTCFGNSDGEIRIYAHGGIPLLSYSVDNGSTYYPPGQNVISGLSSGIYNIKVKDSYNCEVSAYESVTINEPVELVITEVSTTDVVGCNGDNTGTMHITTNGGGTQPYSFSIDNGATFPYGNDISGLGAGVYDVWVQDVNGCTDQFTDEIVEIFEPDPLVIDGSDKYNPLCHGGYGSVEIFAHGGTGDLDYSVNGGLSYFEGNIIGELSAGIPYTIFVKDNNNCFIQGETFTLTEPPEYYINDVDVSNVTDCFGGSNGEIIIDIIGGTPNYQYSIDNGSNWQSSNTFSGLGAGNYYIRVLDDHNCLLVDDSVYTIEQPAPLQISSPIRTNVQPCHGDSNGTIQFSAVGGTPEYTYNIYGPVNQSVSPTLPDIGEFTNLPAGDYSLEIVDANACTVDGIQLTINEPDTLIVSVNEADSVKCFNGNDGRILLSGIGGLPGYQYSLNGGVYGTQNNFQNLQAGYYTFSVKDTYGCEAFGDTTIYQPDSLYIDSVYFTPMLDCYGDNDGSIEVFAFGGIPGYVYSKNSGDSYQSSNTFSFLNAGNYYIMIRDENLCTAFWDEDGDLLIDPVMIDQPDEIDIEQPVVTHITCFGNDDGTITINATGGTGTLMYSIDNGINYQLSNFFDNLSGGTYTVTVRDDNLCEAGPLSVYLNEPNLLEFTDVVVTDEKCPGENNGSVRIYIQGGTSPFRYSVTGGSSWQYDDGYVYEFSDLSPGEYYPVVADTNDCQIDYPPVTIEEAEYSGIVSVEPTEGCSPLEVLFTRQSPGSTIWEFGDDTPNNTQDDSVYHVYINNGEAPVVRTAWAYSNSGFPNYCADSMSMDITVYPRPQLSFTIDPDTAYYPYDQVIISNTSNDDCGNYFWDFGNGLTSTEDDPGQIAYTDCGDYIVRMSAENAWCRDTIEQTAVVIALDPISNIIADTTESCVPVTINFSNSSLFYESFEWDLGDGTVSEEDTVSHTYDTPGIYNVTIHNYGYCDTYGSLTIPITVYSSPVVDFNYSPDTIMLPDQPLHCYNQSSGDSELFFWEFGDGGTSNQEDPIYYYTEPGTYPISLTVTSIHNCIDSLTLSADVVVLPEGVVLFPNAFTPNTGDENSVFKPAVYSSVKKFKMEIYNRWGEKVFYTEDIDLGWDGYYNGVLSLQDAYVWRAEGMYLNGTPFEFAGSVILIR